MCNYILLLGLPGGMEWVLIFLAVLLLFGGKKIPELMRGIGRGVREFNDAKQKVKEDIQEGIKEKDKEKSKEKTEEIEGEK
jgi:sec-independent protein translocase protein TatA